jgi:hypothetical protein
MVYDWDRMGANDMCGICELPMPLSKVRQPLHRLVAH